MVAAHKGEIETDARYAGYLDRQQADIDAFRRDEALVCRAIWIICRWRTWPPKCGKNWRRRARCTGQGRATGRHDAGSLDLAYTMPAKPKRRAVRPPSNPNDRPQIVSDAGVLPPVSMFHVKQ